MSRRIGLIVPSSNVTMETELPQLFTRRADGFTFHSARMRMTTVNAESPAAMDAHSDRCAVELADADCDALAYACLVAVMAAGPGAHQRAGARLEESAGGRAPVVTSAGALIDGIRALGARRVAMIAPYAPALTGSVIAYLADAGIEVVDAISLNVTDNRAVGRLDPGTVGDVDRPAGSVERRRAGAVGVCADAIAARDRTGRATDRVADAVRVHRDRLAVADHPRPRPGPTRCRRPAAQRAA